METLGQLFAGLDPALLTLALAVVLAAAFVRGYSGFGFPLLAVPAMTLVLPPALVVPVLFIVEMAIAAVLLPSAWGRVDWRSLRWILPTALLCLPFGGYLLLIVPAVWMALAIAVLVLIFALLFWSGFALQRRPGPALSLGAGALSGLFGGAVAISGPPVILFYFSSPGTAAVSRASLIFYFFVIDVVGLAVLGYNGLVTQRAFAWAGVLVLPVCLCVWLGKRHFFQTDERTFRRIVLILIFLIGGLGAAKALWELL